MPLEQDYAVMEECLAIMFLFFVNFNVSEWYKIYDPD